MKKIYALTVLLLLAIGAHAQEGKRLYNKYSDSEGVSAVYISPAMFKIMGKIPELNVEVGEGEKFDMAPLINSFSGFYLLNISNKKLADELHGEVKAMIDKGRYEMLMEIKDSGTVARIYTSGNEKTIESFIFIANEPNETAFFCLEGAMNRSDVENLIAKAAK